MATTAKLAIPYPGVNDSSNGPAQMQAIAQKVEDLLSANYTQGGVANVTFSSAATASVTVTFPKPFAATTYALVATGGDSSSYYAVYDQKTTTSVRIFLVHRAGSATSGTFPVSWVAVGAI